MHQSRRETQNRQSSSSLVMRNVIVGGRRTSVRLEASMWDALSEIAVREHKTVHQLVTEVDRQRTESTLTAAIRVYIVSFYRSILKRMSEAAEPFHASL